MEKVERKRRWNRGWKRRWGKEEGIEEEEDGRRGGEFFIERAKHFSLEDTKMDKAGKVPT